MLQKTRRQDTDLSPVPLKNTCFSNISQQQITKIMQKINTRPREKLNFSTPRECFYKKML